MANLWDEKIPYNDEKNDFVPGITAYPAQSKGAVAIFPGGGYGMKANHEGQVIAEWLQSSGITAFVVDYRVAPYKHPAELSDAMRAIKWIRFYADKYCIDRDKIAVMGFSAGGHLAGSVSVHYDKDIYPETDRIDKESCKPNASILCYPVIDLGNYRHDGSKFNLLGERAPERLVDFMSLHKQVNENTPEAFLWHTSTDQAVPVMNTLLYAQALSAESIPYELHIYPVGEHGLGLAPDIPYVAKWKNDLLDWLKLKGWK
ncbi:MAG: alpha/beta hydrolase [Clostridiales bacterium]|nr:alpha/beta hydrolase [Clostridiales bacterium]